MRTITGRMNVLPFAACLLTLLWALAPSAQAQTPAAPEVMAGLKLSAGGKPITYAQLLARCKEADVIFFGELHDDSIGHLAEQELLEDLAALPGPLALGLEMLETEDQTVLDEYRSGFATQAQLEASANLWGNWETDYLPLVRFAVQRKLPIYATNVPRRYASLVARRGLPALDSLSEQAKLWIAPLPIMVPYQQSSYQKMRGMMAGHGMADTAATNRFVAAQAIKDATMGYIIARNRPAGGRLLHINGSFHSDYNEGILYYLRRNDPRVRTLTISYRPTGAEDAGNKALADIVVVGPARPAGKP